MMINKTDVGHRIASLRKKLGLSQPEFAEKLSISTQAVSKWETGQSLPDIEILLNISWMGDTTVNNLLDHSSSFVDHVLPVDRGYRRLGTLLRCPCCKTALKLTGFTNRVGYLCEQGHEYEIDEGVVYFGSREIPGELWSLWLRNYEHYLLEAKNPGLPRYQEGEVPEHAVIWNEISEIKPRTILDIASGTGWGIKRYIDRINWPCTIILTDLSHRILKWNRRFFMEKHNNPYVDLLFLACDCANIPVLDKSIDLVTSSAGFESMQDKWMNGFSEAHRILKEGAFAVYSIALVDDFSDSGTQKWLSLCKQYHCLNENQIYDAAKWSAICLETGYRENKMTKIYGEMPAPDSDEFPFENQVMRWMADYVVVSKKG